MAELSDNGRRERTALADQQARARDVGRYVLALIAYIGLGVLTKGFLSFTYGLLFFLLALEVLPRTRRYLRSRRAMLSEPDTEVVEQ